VAKPSDYYFAFHYDEELGNVVVITGKKKWDRDKKWDGTHPNIIPGIFYDLEENEYEYDGTEKDAKDILLKAGFIENKDILNP